MSNANAGVQITGVSAFTIGVLCASWSAFTVRLTGVFREAVLWSATRLIFATQIIQAEQVIDRR